MALTQMWCYEKAPVPVQVSPNRQQYSEEELRLSNLCSSIPLN